MYEILDNAIDEVQAGHATDVTVGRIPVPSSSYIGFLHRPFVPVSLAAWRLIAAVMLQVELDLGGGWVRISDDGRGIPTDMHPVTGKSALETVLTVLHAGGKFGGGNSGYKVCPMAYLAEHHGVIAFWMCTCCVGRLYGSGK